MMTDKRLMEINQAIEAVNTARDLCERVFGRDSWQYNSNDFVNLTIKLEREREEWCKFLREQEIKYGSCNTCLSCYEKQKDGLGVCGRTDRKVLLESVCNDYDSDEKALEAERTRRETPVEAKIEKPKKQRKPKKVEEIKKQFEEEKDK